MAAAALRSGNSSTQLCTLRNQMIEVVPIVPPPLPPLAPLEPGLALVAAAASQTQWSGSRLALGGWAARRDEEMRRAVGRQAAASMQRPGSAAR